MAIHVATPFFIRGTLFPSHYLFCSGLQSSGDRLDRLRSGTECSWHIFRQDLILIYEMVQIVLFLLFCFELACYSKVIKLAGTCCLLLWQAALRCLNQSIAFILFPA